MKQIKDMNLAELADYFDKVYTVSGAQLEDCADRLRELHNLTRWIPVGEETIPDGKLLRVKIKHPEIETFGTYYNVLGKWRCAVYGSEVTHYQAMTFPEDKP